MGDDTRPQGGQFACSAFPEMEPPARTIEGEQVGAGECAVPGGQTFRDFFDRLS